MFFYDIVLYGVGFLLFVVIECVIGIVVYLFFNSKLIDKFKFSFIC